MSKPLVERVDGTQARLKHAHFYLIKVQEDVERVDGTQARLKQEIRRTWHIFFSCGKGGWDSGEIETNKRQKSSDLW